MLAPSVNGSSGSYDSDRGPSEQVGEGELLLAARRRETTWSRAVNNDAGNQKAQQNNHDDA